MRPQTDMNDTRHFPKVLVLGMDGLDPRRVAEMIDRGQLPAFARLRERGTLCPLATSNPAESPVAWSSLATGCDPGQHGIFDFIHRNPATYLPFLSTQREKGRMTSPGKRDSFVSPRQRPGFWRYTSDAGVPTTVVRWPVTFPAEQVTGNFLAGLGVPDVMGRLGRHAYYTTATVDESKDKHRQVTWKGSRIETDLDGPESMNWNGKRPARVHMTIERAGDGIALNVGSCELSLEPGQWSDWCTVQFKWGPVTICDAIVKFHLVSVEPEFRLFATPPQIHPDNQIWPLTHPAAYGSELADQLGLFYTLGLPEDTHAVTDGCYDLDGFLAQCADISQERRAMFEYELNRFGDGLLAFVFDAGDRIQHMFWSVTDEASPAYDPDRAREYACVMDELYTEMDDVLATALDAAGDETAVFVVSDHGFGPFRRTVHLNRWLIDNGYMHLKNASVGRSLLANVDWTRTRAYALGFSSVYINLAGRESRGIVRGDERAALMAEISDRLRHIVDPEGNHAMVRSVYAGETIYRGDRVADGPDLVVGFEPGYRASWQTALGGAPQGVVEDNRSLWAADHLVDPSTVPGVLASNIRISTGRPEGVELAPTVLECLDVPIPEHMGGAPWTAAAPISGRRSAEASEIEACEAFEPEPVAVGVAADAELDGLDPQEREKLERHLGDLGYLE